MKKILIAVMALATLAGCKKGENDPGISFRSRDARIVGEWKLSSYEYSDETTTTIQSTTTVSSTKTTFSNGSYTTVKNPSSGGSDDSKYEYTLNIEKGGKATLTVVETNPNGPNSTEVAEGDWYWLDADKNKAKIALNVYVSGPIEYFDGGFFDVDELRNKKLVLGYSMADKTSSTGVSGQTVDFKTSVVAEFEQ